MVKYTYVKKRWLCSVEHLWVSSFFINCSTHWWFSGSWHTTWKADKDYCLQHSKTFHQK